MLSSHFSVTHLGENENTLITVEKSTSRCVVFSEKEMIHFRAIFSRAMFDIKYFFCKRERKIVIIFLRAGVSGLIFS